MILSAYKKGDVIIFFFNVVEGNKENTLVIKEFKVLLEFELPYFNKVKKVVLDEFLTIAKELHNK